MKCVPGHMACEWCSTEWRRGDRKAAMETATGGDGDRTIDIELRLLMGGKCDDMFGGDYDDEDDMHWGALVPWGGSTGDRKTRSAVFSALLAKHAALGEGVDVRSMMALQIMQELGRGREASEGLVQSAETFVAGYEKKLTGAVEHANASLGDDATIAERCMVLRESSTFNDRGAVVTVERAAASIAAAVKLATVADSAVAGGLVPVPSTGTEIVPAGGNASAESARSARNPGFTKAITAAVNGANASRASHPHIAAGSVDDRLQKSKAESNAESGLAGGVDGVKTTALAIAARASTLQHDDVRAYTALVRGVLYDTEALPAVRVLQDECSSEEAERAAGTVADAALDLLLKSLGPHLVLKGEQAAVSAHHLRKAVEATARSGQATIAADVTAANILPAGAGRRSRGGGASTAGTTTTTQTGTATRRSRKRKRSKVSTASASKAARTEKPVATIACRANRETGIFEYLVDWGDKYGAACVDVDDAIRIADEWDGTGDPIRYIWTDVYDEFWDDVVALPTFRHCAHVFFDDDDDDDNGKNKGKKRKGNAEDGAAKRVRVRGPLEVHASWGIDAGALELDDPEQLRAALAAVLSSSKDKVGDVVSGLPAQVSAAARADDDDTQAYDL